ncbi:hypothetical protein [Pseudomonas deceptionensis]|uniref:Uncharacterized protein n=1 Tax=Pseudomonas deceptionensis TaxID=882211 RepID=A0A0J6J278_PSEDM|nr:hypothetical protein [Pseudomonas deceptionensis]KMM77962.1 hypothetical protein TR67_20770 [Pseudomonas deceptionensis]SEE97499.1 hypothetical protein SAMN04489800_3246 [Pseudomonas deceptionensis]
MNTFYTNYILSAKTIASTKGLEWDLPHDTSGKVSKNARWDLASMAGMVTPPFFWHSSLSYDNKALEVLNDLRQRQSLTPMCVQPLSRHWRDYYQAVLINEILVKKNKPGHALINIGRPLRIIATCAGNEEPWDLTAASVALAYRVALSIGTSGKLAANVAMIVRTIIDGQHVANRSPLAQYCVHQSASGISNDSVANLKKSNNTYRRTDKVKLELAERKDSAKLPSEKAFWELIRIIFTEQPKTFVDAIRFNQLKLAVATGFRIGESILLPLNWAKWHDYYTPNGSLAGTQGGISRSLAIRHFAEKQACDTDASGVLLYEAIQHVPTIFEELVSEAFSEAERLTGPLRDRLRLQINTGRLLPEFNQSELVPAWDIYSRMSGSIWFASPPLPSDLIDKYRVSFDPAYLDEMRRIQISQIPVHGVSPSCMKYFKKLPIIIRHKNGDAFEGKVDWKRAYLRVSEVETLMRETMTTKLPDCAPFRLSNAEVLYPSELMFLMPIRALIEERNGGILDVNRYLSVGRASSLDMQNHLGASANNIFSRYGQDDADRELKLNTHSLRHLQNAELFRLGVADTIITKRFNRKSVTQSYVYDHRSLSEALANIDIPQEAESIAPRARETLKMIMAGKIRGPIVDEFLKIQSELGDEHAFNYLSVEADGLHVTPYGFCVNSFTVDPCSKHLECFDCRHLARSENPQEQATLENMKLKMIEVVNIIELNPQETRNIGWQNQLNHAKSRLSSLEVMINTPPSILVFPNGQDRYRSLEKMASGSIMDTPKKWSPE